MAFYPQFNNLTDQQLKAAGWWLGHRAMIKIVILVMLILTTVWIWFSLIQRVVIFFSRTLPELTSQQAAVISSGRFALVQPQPLITDEHQVLLNTDGSLDLAVRVTNPNKDWDIKNLSFQFNLTGSAVPGRPVYLAPEQTTLLVILNLPWQQRLPDKINVSLMPNWHKILAPVSLLTVSVPIINQTANLTQADWQVTNQTLRHYWRVPFSVAAYSHGQLVAVNVASIDKLKINEARSAAASWYGELPKIDQVEIFPQLDFYESSNWWDGVK